MIDKSLVYQAVVDKIAETDYFIVNIKITTDNNITVEIDSNDGVDVQFCADLLRYIESVFDREVEDYALEVGSASISEPFKVVEQYYKNLGSEVEVLTKAGQKLTGVLVQVDEDKFAIEVEKKVKAEGAKRKVTVAEKLEFAYEEVKYTKYIIRFK